MIAQLRIFVFILFPFISYAQTPGEDEIKLKAAMDWLDNKLNYIYYDNVGEQWWSNTFYANESAEVTIKHIASKRPNTANIKDKTYTIRRFRIQDINPKSLKITQIDESKGRIVKGQMLELRTFGFQDAIHKTINNRRASSTSFLFLSFPETLIDSLSNYAEIVKQKFEKAILASTQIYPVDFESDVMNVLDILTGSFETDEGKSLSTERLNKHVIKFEYEDNRIEYFGYDPTQIHFYHLSINEQGLKQQNFKFTDGNQLKLIDENSQIKVLIQTTNSFQFYGDVYFRQ